MSTDKIVAGASYWECLTRFEEGRVIIGFDEWVVVSVHATSCAGRNSMMGFKKNTTYATLIRNANGNFIGSGYQYGLKKNISYVDRMLIDVNKTLPSQLYLQKALALIAKKREMMELMQHIDDVINNADTDQDEREEQQAEFQKVLAVFVELNRQILGYQQ